ncbi:MAG: Fic family protein [Actinobacteria bacterium]|nr:Fic family protein [Actinomycetota bacterium]
MIYAVPDLADEDVAALEGIEALRTQLRFYLREPRRWYGSLRRTTFARAVQASNSIEGYHASVEDVVAVIDGEDPIAADEATRQAIEGYRDAMTYVLQLGMSPPMARLDASLVRSLHFMMLKHELPKNPGRWRPGPVWLEDRAGDVVYHAPPREDVDDLVAAVLAAACDGGGEPIVRAAMAHLNLTLVHPFSDGNGRMARCIQSYVLASEGILSPEFLSIEEYLGHHTPAYYEVLTEVARGRWSPERDARPWLRFCLVAHHRQAETLLRRIDEAEALWDACEQLARSHRLPDRSVGSLCDAARGWRIRRALYVKAVRSSAGEEITDATATRDLAALTRAGLLEAVGDRRGRNYRATPVLAGAWRAIRDARPPSSANDPYAGRST